MNLKKKIKSFPGQKGGVGKSTGARNTHAKEIHLGIKSILLDCDSSQHSSFEFNKRREFFRARGLDVPALNVVKMNHEDLRGGIVEYAKKFESVIVDPGGRVDKETELAMAISDMLILWLRYGQDEMDTLPTMQQLFIHSRNSSVPAFLVPNQISTHAKVQPLELKKLYDWNQKKSPIFKMTNSFICMRDAYKQSREEGLAIFETKGPGSRLATLEFNNYFKELFHG